MPRPRCPRCRGWVYWDYQLELGVGAERGVPTLTCLACGWYQQPPPLPFVRTAPAAAWAALPPEVSEEPANPASELALEDAAALVGVQTGTLRRWVREGVLAARAVLVEDVMELVFLRDDLVALRLERRTRSGRWRRS